MLLEELHAKAGRSRAPTSSSPQHIGVAESEAADLIAHVGRAGHTLPLRPPVLLLDERPNDLQEPVHGIVPAVALQQRVFCWLVVYEEERVLREFVP